MHAYSNWFWELGAGFWQFGIQTPGTLDVLPSIRWGCSWRVIKIAYTQIPPLALHRAEVVT